MDEIKEKKNQQENEDFSQLMEEYSLKSIKQSSHVEGVIIDIIDNNVIVDIGQKTEGILNKEELLDWEGNFNHKIGDNVTVVCQNVNMKHGYLIVSKKNVDRAEGWKKISDAYDNNSTIPGRILNVSIDGRGFKVDAGAEMFLPMTQADIRKVKNPNSLVGKKFDFKVVKLNPKEKSGVLSRRILMEEERSKELEILFSTLKEGDLLKGVVTRIEDYGAFVNIGALDGLLHKDNISYSRVNHPKEKLRKDDELEVKVLSIDKENNKVSLGLKQKYQDPWINIKDKYPVGHRLEAKVMKTVDFGAFIELEEGVEGLLHISDLTWEGKPKSVEEYVGVGERMWVQVIELNPEERRIKLGLKQLGMRPELKYMENHNKGEIVDGLVKKIIKSRVFVELEKGIEGVIKISDICYFRIDSPDDYLKEKETIKAMIISDDLDMNYKVKLGYKQLHEDKWNEFFATNKPGVKIKVKVKAVTETGIRCEISEFVEGFIRLGEIDEKKITFEEAKEKFLTGTEYEVVVQSTDRTRKRVYLSFRELKRKKDKEDLEKIGKSESESVTTVGDLFESALDKKK
ncbi:MAG: S1 RNA-binding domain-containing protein [Candidatus Aminicenantes bacterium]|nr:S1 RNA-binding domain-containing protein [Candidatus Aminicenantes bacterium]